MSRRTALQQLRWELSVYGRRRRAGQSQIDEADERLVGLFAQAQKRPDITMSEAADIAGVSRPLAYRLMGKVGGSGDA